MNTDRELIERIRTGNEAAFNTLFDRHADRVRRRAMGIVRDAAAAEDLVQEVF
ncbi:MAG: RNA polymerase subunit sigma-24, partial [Candidatus Hydrogenedentes bacterium]|nr:RNA polymerase subunit sigma-24 [Candidatus Hydrogenedentota bacterium]